MCQCACVRAYQNVNSQLSKVSNKTQKSNIRSCVQNFKLTNKYQITILRSTKNFKTNMNMHSFFFFSKKKKSGTKCVNVSPIPPNLNCTLSPMCKYMERSYPGDGETGWDRYDSKHSPQTCIQAQLSLKNKTLK
jgi:hypothetical protein